MPNATQPMSLPVRSPIHTHPQTLSENGSLKQSRSNDEVENDLNRRDQGASENHHIDIHDISRQMPLKSSNSEESTDLTTNLSWRQSQTEPTTSLDENLPHPNLSNPEGYQNGFADTKQNLENRKSKENSVGNVIGSDDRDSESEIQSIIDQFDHGETASGDELKSTNLSASFGGSSQHPPRKSSLEPTQFTNPQAFSVRWDSAEIGSPKSSCFNNSSRPQKDRMAEGTTPVSSYQGSAVPKSRSTDSEIPLSPSPSISLSKPLPPEPDPEPDLPFDFHRFLEQLRHRTADPVAKFLRSFLVEFGKKQWMAHEQVKIISDFLTFISGKMVQCDVWHGVSEAEFDNAKEGMEKLVMNRLYSQTFSPSIPSSISVSESKSKSKNLEKGLGTGRRGQHQEDIERDDILSQKVRIYGWIEEEHLDIPPVGENGRRFLNLAQQELLKIQTYRAPRDKIICVLNCCKVIFGLLRNSKAPDTSADSFVPLLIYVVIHANPDHLVSNVQYILRFRNQDKLVGEAGYYLSSLMGAIQFIENLDRTSLTVSDATFEKKVEAAVSAIVERHEDKMPSHLHKVAEKSGLSEPKTIPQNSVSFEHSDTSKKGPLDLGGMDRPVKDYGSDESRAVSGLLRTIQRPLTSIGRIFSEEHPSYPPPSLSPRLSPAVFQPPRKSNHDQRPFEESLGIVDHRQKQLQNPPTEDTAVRKASAESAEAERIHTVEHNNIVETLAGMFPDLDRDVIDDVVRVKQGRVGLAVDACLGLSS